MPRVLFGFMLLACSSAAADEVRLTNGDAINGSVVSLDADTLVIKSETLGELTIKRSLVAAIGLGPDGLPEPIIVAPPAENGSAPAAGGINMNQMLQDPQVQQQFGTLLQEALGGRQVGDVQNDLRRTQRQLRELQQDLGGLEGEAIGSYLKMFDLLGGGLGAAGALGGLNPQPPQAPQQPNQPPAPPQPAPQNAPAAP